MKTSDIELMYTCRLFPTPPTSLLRRGIVSGSSFCLRTLRSFKEWLERPIAEPLARSWRLDEGVEVLRGKSRATECMNASNQLCAQLQKVTA